MAEFTVDTAQLESVSGKLKSLGSQVDGVASRVYSTSQSIGGIKSIKNKGYVGKIHDVRTSLRSIADDTSMMSDRMTQIANAYIGTESKISGSFGMGMGVEDGSADSSSTKSGKKKNPWAIMIETLGFDLASVLDGFQETGSFIENFHRWRATRGSEIVKTVAEKASEIPALKELLDGIVEDANKTVSNYENILYGALNFTNIDALAKGADSFANQLGFNWIGKVGNRLKSRTDYYVNKGAKQIVDGHVVEGAFTAIGGSLLAFGDMAVDTSVKTVKWVVKHNPVVEAVKSIPGVKQALSAGEKVREAMEKAITGKTRDEWINQAFGKLGDGIRGAFDQFTNWGKKK